MIAFLLSPAGRAIAAVVAVSALLGGVWLHGRSTGVESAEARHAVAVAELEADLRQVSIRAAQAEAQRLQIERARNDLLAELDRAGDSADGAGRLALPADSVQRIDRIGRGD